MKKFGLRILPLIALVIAMAGCNRTITGDVQADKALEAFNDTVKQNPDRKGFHEALQHWGFVLTAGDKFEWSKDTSANEIDFAMVMTAEPFLNSGLDISKLDGSGYVFSRAKQENGKPVPDLLIHPFNVSDKKETSQGSEDAMRRLLKQEPSLVGYLGEQQCYRLMLGGGFEVQWAEKPGLDSADMTFIIEADPLTAAGVDISKMKESGWVFEEADDGSDTGKIPNRFVKMYKLDRH